MAFLAFLRRAPWPTLAIGLLVIDAAFIGIQVATDVTDYGFNGSFRLALETEGGIAQTWGWLQLAVAAGLLLVAWSRHRSAVTLFWAGSLAYLSLDDALAFHEKLGSRFASGLPGIAGLRPQDVGEAIAYVSISAVALALLIAAERTSPAPPSRLTLLMVPFVGLFLWFATVVDMLRSLPIAFEDGGELIAITLIALAAAFWTEAGAGATGVAAEEKEIEVG